MNRSYTEQMDSLIYEQWDYVDEEDENYINLIKNLNKPGMFRTFGEALIMFLRKFNPTLEKTNVIDFLEEECKMNGMHLNDIKSKSTLNNWLKTDMRPDKGEASRKSMFALAFALRLTPEETANLFHNVYLDRAFNCRNIHEIVYYFCLNTNRSWSDANRLIDTVDRIENVQSNVTLYTFNIQDAISDINEEDELISYINEHVHNLFVSNISAKLKLSELLEKCKADAQDEAAEEIDKNGNYKYKDIYKGKRMDNMSNNVLYEIITGQITSSPNGTKTIIQDAQLPQEIRNRFPEAVTLSKKNHTYEEIRKLIILLFSYDYWYQRQQTGKKTMVQDYENALNVKLLESGLPPVYYGNPYDWLFLFCDLGENPLFTFRTILHQILTNPDNKVQ